MTRRQRARRAEASKDAKLSHALQAGKLSNECDQHIWHEREAVANRLKTDGAGFRDHLWRSTMTVLGMAGVKVGQKVDEGSVICLALVFQNSTLCRDMDDGAIEELVAAIAAVGKPGFGARRGSLWS